jgi:hypothetical protein
MLGLPLVYEMALVFTLACLLAWVMGRTFCKSNEYEIRTINKSLQAANDRLECLLVKKDQDIHQLSQRMQAEQKTVTELQNLQKITENLFAKLQVEHQASLATIQELAAYRIQFEELSKVHDDQSKQVVMLQATIRQTQDEMAQTIALGKQRCNVLENNVLQFTEDKHNTDLLILEQQAVLTTYQQKQQALENEINNRNECIAQLEKQHSKLQEINGRLEVVLAEKDEGFHQLSQRLQAERKTVAELQSQQKITENLFAKLQEEYQASLATIQELIAYRTQFEELSKVHNDQSKQVVLLRETIKQTLDEMAQAIALGKEQCNVLENTILQLQEEKRNNDAFISDQKAVLTTYQQKQQALESDVSSRDGLIVQLKKQNIELQETNKQQSKAIDILHEKVNGYLQSVNVNNRRITNMLSVFPYSPLS